MNQSFIWTTWREQPLAKRRRRWKYDIKMYLKRHRIWWCGLDSCSSWQRPVTASFGQGNKIVGSKEMEGILSASF